MSDRRLLRHLTVVVILKLAVLATLWWGFVRETRLGVDSEAAAAHLMTPRAAPADATPSRAGAAL